MKAAYGKYIAALLLFGSNGIIASFISLSSYEIVFMRTLIGSLFLVAVFLLSRQKVRFYKHKKQFLYLMISGAAMGVSWMFLFEAYRQVGVSVASLAYYCGPVIVMALAPVVFRERVSAVKVIGLAAVILGMLLVNSRGLRENGLSVGLVFGVLSAVMYAVMVIFNKKAADITGLENPMWQLSVSCVAAAVYTLIADGGGFSVPAGSMLPLVFLGVVNTGVGCYLYFSSIGKLSAQSVSICGYLEPLSALVFSAAFLGERLAGVQWAGAALILGGAAFGELYQRKGVRGEQKAKENA